ncbi:ATP-binding protein [Paraburkholderia acidipaludis]|uniref:ATP-binding protein n=1 Tax=Paraburkholderia acidipaludis TaxID=660537 RepID=UPI0006936B3D|nr:transporter substrate-binding domain-containing protein [Paraburkholderia acidipaludis]
MKALSRVSGYALAAAYWRRSFVILIALMLAAVLVPGSARASAPAGAASALATASMAGGTPPFPPKLIVGVVAGGWPPLDVLDVLDGGALSGFSADYLRLAIGAPVELEPRVYRDMPALLDGACAGEVDVIMSLARSPLRERCLAFTAPYLSGSTVFVTRAGNEGVVTAARRLGHARLAVERGYALEPILRERFRLADIRAYASTDEALRAVATGAADVYAGFAPVVRYRLSLDAFRMLRIACTERLRLRDLRFAVPASKRVLRDRLNMALAGVRPAAASGIRARWLDGTVGLVPVAPAFTLSSAERAWLQALPSLKVGVDADWSPFSLIGGAQRPEGIANDYLDYLGSTLGVVFERVPVSGWARAAEPFRRGELALLATSLHDEVVGANAVLTQPLERYPLVLVGRRDEPMARGIGDFSGRRIVLAPHTPGAAQLAADPPAVSTVRAASVEAALWMVAHDQADVAIGNAAALDLPLSRQYAGSLKVLGTIAVDDAVGFAVCRDLAPLAALIDRALAAMPPDERQQIRNRWTTGAAGHTQRWSVNALRLLPFVIAFGVVLLVTLRAYVLLQREMRRRSRAEQTIARARDLAEAASRAKDDFLAMMSHEIRTPMNGVLGLVEVLERTPLNADQTRMVDMVHESAGALLQILDDLLDYSKIQAGRLAIVSEPFEVRALVDNAVGLLAQRAHEKGLKMFVDIGSEVAARLRGDSVRLRQILFNLLSNAIKFTPAGEVSVSVSALQPVGAACSSPARQRLVITVADTGIGIAQDAQVQLFEPFVQAESSTTRRFGGTGLGLTICRRLAALMGGTLELESELGRGTALTLRIELPIEARSAHADGLVGKRALVLCDDARVAAALTHFGTSLGMRMTCIPGDVLGEFAARRQASFAERIDLILASDSYVSGLSRLGAPVISLTDKPKPTGYRIAENGVRLSMNPLSWRGLSAACAMALAGLPAAAACSASGAEAAHVAPEREREHAAGRLILVAEDHPVNQELIRRQLALLGFACDVVNDGAEALAAMEENRYGCLITDCHMPNLSGYDLARRVREIERERNGDPRLPILAITASTGPESLQLCHAAGMDDCLVKPTRVATLREHLARWFGAGGAHRPRGESVVAAPRANPAAVAPAAARHSGPLDLARMIQVWGSEATVKALLGSFVSAVRDDLDALPPLLERVDIARMREWHHRLAGAVGVLHYPALLALLETYRRHMDIHTPAQLREEGLALVRTGHAMLDDIGKQAALLA